MRRGTNKDVAHSWAHQQADTAAGSFYHEGPNLVSYNTTSGWHFGDFVLLSLNSFTPTTNTKHLSPARYATIHLRQIGMNLFTYGYNRHNAPTPEMILSDLECQFADILKAYPRKRNKACAVARLQYIAESAEVVAERFHEPVPAGIAGCNWEDLHAAAAIAAEEERKREEIRLQNEEKALQKRREEDAEAYAAFLKGETSRCPASYRTVAGSHSLTIIDRGGPNQAHCRVTLPESLTPTVVTSDGARASLQDVEKALAMYDRIRSKGRRWVRNGETIPVGGYQIDRIDADGTVHAGCHTFSAAEIDRFRKQWGL